MARTSDLDRVASIVLRMMRGPLLLLVATYAIGVTGMVLIPGADAEGNPTHMSLFHAFYFFTYTATTTGFGEIPNDFNELQRLWAIFCLFMGVIAWIYAIGSIIRLVQNPYFLQALAERRFARSVKGIREPFFIICGFGDTGSLLARGLSDEGVAGVIIDSDTERIKALGLRDYRVTMLGVCADASAPKHLLDAGVRQSYCQGVLALTSDEHINLKIAVMARSLNPLVPIICRSTDLRHQEELAMLDNVTVVDPFDTFAHQLSAALQVPLLHTFTDWLIGVRDAALDNPLKPPLGTWILCGYGRMGRDLYTSLQTHSVPIVVIDPRMENADDVERKIVGHTTGKTLQEAGVEQTVGIVAGTDSDSNNLGILLKARALNKNIFLVVRQNHHENEVAFDAANANLIMQPSLVTARRILLKLIAPMIEPFLDHLREHYDLLLEDLVDRLREAIGDNKPQLWTTAISETGAPAVTYLQQQGHTVTLGTLGRDPANRTGALPCLPLVLAKGRKIVILPREPQVLQAEDRILFCGTLKGHDLLDATVRNPYTLHYLLTGREEPRSHLFRWCIRRLGRKADYPLP